MSEQAEKAIWQARSEQALDEVFPRVYADPAQAKRLFQRLVDAVTVDARQMLASEIERLVPLGGRVEAKPLPKVVPGLRRERESPAGRECPKCGWYGAIHECAGCGDPVCLRCFLSRHGQDRCSREPGMEG